MPETPLPALPIAVTGPDSALLRRLRERFGDAAPADAVVAVHVAAGRFESGAAPDRLHETLVVRSGQTLDALDPEQIRRLILISDAGVLGRRTPYDGVAEDAAAQPGDSFARALHAVERLTGAWADDVGAVLVVLRIAPLVGPTDESRLAELAADLPASAALDIGDARWSVATPARIAHAVAAAAIAPSHQVAGRAFTVADPEPVRLSDLAARLASELGVAVPAPSGLLARLRRPDAGARARRDRWSDHRVYRSGSGLSGL